MPAISRIALLTSTLLLAPVLGTAAAPAPAPLDAVAAGRFANLALKCLHQEYPNKIAHVLAAAEDAKPPRVLYPAFFGCYDWHSAVHAHWLLVRLAKQFPKASFAAQARTKLALSLTPANLAAETAYLQKPGRPSFERPYGLAWVLMLGAELRTWKDPQASQWTRAIAPLEAESAARIKKWLPDLTYPIRVGEHDQTAFAFGLIWDWAGVANDQAMRAALSDAGRRYYLQDRDCPLAYEPGGQDFLSPCLAEADFMRRVLNKKEFGAWLDKALPQVPLNGHSDWLKPAIVSNRADPKLAHLDGLNLSRAWMLEGIAKSLPDGDRRVFALRNAAQKHRDAALPAVTGEHYEGGHWLGTFAVYLTTNAGK